LTCAPVSLSLSLFPQGGAAPILGLLPVIEHAFLALGPMLYMWPYRSPDKPVVQFSGLDADITAVGLVPPKPRPDGNFADTVHTGRVLPSGAGMGLLALGEK